MTDDEWVQAATANDFLVVDLLLRLTHSSPQPPPPPPPPPSSSLPLHWSVRQPRSKSIALKPGIARASPTTPLSWSGATSQSGGAGGVGVVDGSEESSRPATGSKVIGTSEATPTKRSRKKKTMTELKEEEVSLLKERKDLKRNISTLLITLRKKRASNESLKRMKMDFTTQRATEGVATFASEETSSNQTTDKLAACSPDHFMLRPSVTVDDPAALPALPPPDTCFEMQKEITVHENKFVVPDLNVALEESSTEGIHGGELKNDQE